MKYRRKVVEEKMQAIEYGYEIPAIDVLSAIKKINAAWKSVTSTTIRNFYRKAGFKKDDDVEVEEKEEDLEAVEVKWVSFKQFQAIDLKQFMFVDSNLLSRGILTDGQIVNSVAKVHVEEDEIEQDNGSEDFDALSR